MKIENLQELKKLLKLCHEQGVRSIEIDGIKMLIGDLPSPAGEVTSDAPKTPADFSDEELLMWSAAGHEVDNG